MNRKKSKKLFMILLGLLLVVVLVFGVILLFKNMLFKPTILNKTTFSEADKNIIAEELDIPADKFTVEKMRFTHAKDSYFCITIKTSSLELLSLYEYKENDNYNNRPEYLKRDNNDPHNNIVCTVISNDPYELDFELHNWNKKLYSIIK
ncbi:hypothetical protein [uncultured Ruminococcus sp.]|uniref:hypothetical protein n=1 Tax=uncultured Ruminococcus sp. TaxID=165186 RepID=UPI00261C6EFB|nr:hypothetical protein [uncultured Ruminococcus sp.]